MDETVNAGRDTNVTSMSVQRVDNGRTRKKDPQGSQAQNCTQGPDRNLARDVEEPFDRICAELVGKRGNNEKAEADPDEKGEDSNLVAQNPCDQSARIC